MDTAHKSTHNTLHTIDHQVGVYFASFIRQVEGIKKKKIKDFVLKCYYDFYVQLLNLVSSVTNRVPDWLHETTTSVLAWPCCTQRLVGIEHERCVLTSPEEQDQKGRGSR